MSNNAPQNYGYLVVRVSTARGAVPVAGAEVILRGAEQDNSDIMYSAITSNVGLTPVIILPSPPRSTSESPGQEHPFSKYNIEVRAEGYGPQNYNNVEVFEGITSYQNVVLIPLSDNQAPDNFNPNAGQNFDAPPPEL